MKGGEHVDRDRVTDMTAAATRIFAAGYGRVQPADVLLAVEVELPSSITTDRVTTPAQYAAAGIEHFWRVEMDPLRLHVYRLGGDGYELLGSWGEDEVAEIADPFEVAIELSTLLP